MNAVIKINLILPIFILSSSLYAQGKQIGYKSNVAMVSWTRDAGLNRTTKSVDKIFCDEGTIYGVNPKNFYSLGAQGSLEIFSDKVLTAAKSIKNTAFPILFLYISSHGEQGVLCSNYMDTQYDDLFKKALMPAYAESKDLTIIAFITACYSGTAIQDAAEVFKCIKDCVYKGNDGKKYGNKLTVFTASNSDQLGYCGTLEWPIAILSKKDIRPDSKEYIEEFLQLNSVSFSSSAVNVWSSYYSAIDPKNIDLGTASVKNIKRDLQVGTPMEKYIALVELNKRYKKGDYTALNDSDILLSIQQLVSGDSKEFLMCTRDLDDIAGYRMLVKSLDKLNETGVPLKVIDGLKKALKDDDPKIRRGAIVLFRNLKVQDVDLKNDITQMALKDRDPKVRLLAARTLKPIDNDVLLKLSEALNSEFFQVRLAAASAFGEIRINDPVIISKLKSMSSKDPIPHVRDAAKKALLEMGIKDQ